ncbi:MAG: hypothetical protein LBE91_09650 [Tannerella sp.]|jgi:hypothetical protein|nr:hypothetical protein [Tannerella sp.]
MMTLERVKLQRFDEISINEQMMMKGGGDDPPLPGSGTYDDPYQLPEVTVYGKYSPPKPEPCTCDFCEQFDKSNNPISGDGPVTTPLGEYLIKEFSNNHSECCPWND